MRETLAWAPCARRFCLCADLPAMPQEGVGKNACDHRFTDRHGAYADTWVMAAFGDDLRILAPARDGAERGKNRGRRLDGEARDDGLPGRDAAENAARVIGEK